MLEDLIGSYGMRFLIAALGVGLALVCFVVAMMIIRRRAPSPFVRGGKNRQPRLQVLDAAAVDARRRLVLIRRDDVEHLVMIGGPTDIVIESGIGAAVDAVEARSQPVAAVAPAPERRAAAERPPMPAAEPIRATPQAEPVAIVAERTPSPRPAPQPPVPALPQQVAPPPLARVQPQAAAPVLAPPPAAMPARSAAPPVQQDAAAVLDAARERVLPQQVERPAAQTSPAAPPSPPISQPRPAAAKTELGSEFDRILEAEMASNLSAGRVTLDAAPPAQIAGPKREPQRPVITGAGPSQDPVQKEMARIFGEMSVTRDN